MAQASKVVACGNSIIEIQQKNENLVALDGTEYKDFIDSAEKGEGQMVYDGPCGKKVPKGKQARRVGGKIDDSVGWYLPFIYLDGVVEILEPKWIDCQIKDVLAGNPHCETVQRLRQELSQDQAIGVLSPPFGETSYVLVYTDALVLNKAKYEQGNDEYREAMFKFSQFFTTKLRQETLMSTTPN
ncbi:uncharacterized protein LOC130648451 [Hydractinia symbiolongicarpus]|uniref:uncharacterized protein LOC130648451 n=1 Tax=Hydractinia symbiolongicarpus TaxID=13093 RepID=UPI00254B6B06|nr:uncharacterized protein LOC130648451 [Hydractinia symbiolongicarpus]